MTPTRWFNLGSFGLLVLGALHFFSNRNGLPIMPTNSNGAQLLELMASYEINFFGLNRTLDQTIDGFIITWGTMVIAIALINLVMSVRDPSIPPPKLMRLANAIAWIICLITAVFFWSYPQMGLFAFISFAFVMSLMRDSNVKKKPVIPDSGEVPRVAVVGAGAAGMTTAFALQKKGYKVTVLEKLDRVGGKCKTLEFGDYAIDIGAHEMLAGYTDVMRIAREVDAPSHGSQDILVYDRFRHQYMDIMSASTSTGYTNLQVAWASLRYTWMLMTRYRKFAKPGTGLSDAPQELLQPVGTWLRQMNLNAMEEIVLFVMKVQGYGRLDEASAAHFVKFQGFRNWVSNVLHNIGLLDYWPRVFSNGFQDLWERVAERLDDVRLDTEITSIRRVPKEDSETIGVEIKIKGTRKPEHFDQIVITCPHNLATLRGIGLDLDEEEEFVFSKVKYHNFTTTTCRVQGIPSGVVGTIPLPRLLDYTGYIKVYPESDITVFFTLSQTADPDHQEIYKNVENTVASLPESEEESPKVLELLHQKTWHYFPHPEVAEMAANYFDRLQALQGHRQTFYAGALLEMETVGNTVANAQHLADTQFPPLR
ncbi:MAG: FAD-dependent oxidoreductase [Pseudomonadota bacterium]